MAGCTHLTELTQVLPTAVIQAFAGEVLFFFLPFIAMLREREAMGLNEITLLPSMATARDNLKDFAKKLNITRAPKHGREGSFGFLCGLQSGQTDHGAAAAHGYDPQGRFLGAKLKLSF